MEDPIVGQKPYELKNNWKSIAWIVKLRDRKYLLINICHFKFEDCVLLTRTMPRVDLHIRLHARFHRQLLRLFTYKKIETEIHPERLNNHFTNAHRQNINRCTADVI